MYAQMYEGQVLGSGFGMPIAGIMRALARSSMLTRKCMAL